MSALVAVSWKTLYLNASSHFSARRPVASASTPETYSSQVQNGSAYLSSAGDPSSPYVRSLPDLAHPAAEADVGRLLAAARKREAELVKAHGDATVKPCLLSAYSLDLASKGDGRGLNPYKTSNYKTLTDPARYYFTFKSSSAYPACYKRLVESVAEAAMVDVGGFWGVVEAVDEEVRRLVIVGGAEDYEGEEDPEPRTPNP